MKITLINEKDRTKLCEGRQYQMGFGFAKKIEKNVYEMIQPISACKDYLNDVVYTESTGKSIGAVFGFHYGDKKDLFKNNDPYLVFSILDYKIPPKLETQRTSYPTSTFIADKERLNKNYLEIQKMINDIEDLLKVKKKSEFIKIDDNLFLSKMDMFWVSGTHLISLYSLLIRAFQHSDGYQDPMKFLESYPYNIEQILVQGALPRLKNIISGGYNPKEPNDKIPYSVYLIHNCGILAYQ
jgi:hypothetical protein